MTSRCGFCGVPGSPLVRRRPILMMEVIEGGAMRWVRIVFGFTVLAVLVVVALSIDLDLSPDGGPPERTVEGDRIGGETEFLEDVTVGDCTAANDVVTCGISIRNGSRPVADYIIHGTVVDSKGVTVGEATGGYLDVGSGERVETQISAPYLGRDDDVTVTVTSVEKIRSAAP